MTPPPAATQAAHGSLTFAPSRTTTHRHAAAFARWLDQRSWSRVRLAVDAIVLYLATAATLFASPVQNTSANRWLAVCFPLIAIAVIHLRPGADQRMNGSVVDTLSHVLGMISLTAIVTIAFESLFNVAHPIDLALRFWLFGFVYVAGARIALISIRRQALRSDALAAPTLIVGAGVVGEQIVKRLAGESRYGLRPVGFIDADPMPRTDRAPLSLPLLGGPDDLASAIDRTGARHVIIAFSSGPDHVLVDKVRQCATKGVEISLVPRLYETVNERAILDHVGGTPLLTLRHVDPRGWKFAVKHTFDRVVAAIALLAIAPVMLGIALAVRVSSPGPICFRQRRVGRDGAEFDMLKFRTMREVAHAAEFVPAEGCAPGGVEGVDRRTAIGRWLRDWSLDELPQLINVLRGDMSIVGPRPERPEYVARFSAEVDKYGDRHRVKSGITGWAQVCGLRGQTSIGDRVEWDNHYIQNWSLGMDFRIIALTVLAVLRDPG